MPEVQQVGRFYPEPAQGVAPRQFALNANRVKTRKILLDTAREHERVHVGGVFLWAVEASSRTAKMYVSLSEESGDQGIPFKEGSAFQGVPFSSVWITNDAQAGEWITLVYVVSAEGQINIDNPGALFTSVDLVKATTASDTADQSIANGATVTIAANASRRALVIYAKSTNTGSLRTGPTAAAARGRELQPGIEHIWNVTAAIKVHNDSGAAQTFGYAEETD